MKNVLLCCCAVLTLSALFVLEVFGADRSVPAITPEQIEADWLRQDVVRRAPSSMSNRLAAALTTQQDAAGGCDGIREGTYGFHTNRDANPWWHVDLGQLLSLDRVAIYNRCDGDVEDRAGHLDGHLRATPRLVRPGARGAAPGASAADGGDAGRLSSASSAACRHVIKPAFLRSDGESFVASWRSVVSTIG